MIKVFYTVLCAETSAGTTRPSTARALHDAAWALLAAALPRFDSARAPDKSAPSAPELICGVHAGTLPAISRAAHGKPSFDDPALPRFSLSHSGKIAVCALSDEGEIGVDVQERKARIDIEGISRRFFHPAEREYLRRIDGEEDRSAAFFRIFSCKEAYVKMTGRGLSEDFTGFRADLRERRIITESGIAGSLFFPAWSEAADYTLALCAPAASRGHFLSP